LSHLIRGSVDREVRRREKGAHAIQDLRAQSDPGRTGSLGGGLLERPEISDVVRAAVEVGCESP
jgi:hypothetical protein